jgi:hypothetical protein
VVTWLALLTACWLAVVALYFGLAWLVGRL